MAKPTAIVTGAASGIGQALAAQIAELGYRVVLVDQDQPGLDALVAKQNKRLDCSTYRLDVSSGEDWQSLASSLESEQQDVALLVQSAGVLLAGPLGECDPAEVERLVRVNLTGTLLGAGAIGPLLRNSVASGPAPPLPRGMLNIASIFALVAPPGFAAYNASKAGVVAATETLASEWKPARLQATAVLPGVTRTALFDRAAYASAVWRDAVQTKSGEAVLTPEQVAKAAIAAYRRGRVVAPIGGRASRYHFLKRLFPGFIRRAVARQADRDLPH